MKTTAICTAMLTEPEDSLERQVALFSRMHPVFMSICTKDGVTSVIISGENHSQRQLTLSPATTEYLMKSFARYLCRGRAFCQPDDVFAQLKKMQRCCACLNPGAH